MRTPIKYSSIHLYIVYTHQGIRDMYPDIYIYIYTYQIRSAHKLQAQAFSAGGTISYSSDTVLNISHTPNITSLFKLDERVLHIVPELY